MNVSATCIDTDAELDRVSRTDAPQTLGVRFSLQATWTIPPGPLTLTAVYLLNAATTRAFVTDQLLEIPAATDFEAAAHRCGAAIFDLAQPLSLVPAQVPKPWGMEIWHSAIEARGVSGVTDGRHTTPLPWILACAPRRLCRGESITLLKTLEPRPDAVVGDLYFELHDVKDEVYVVTHVDRRAWPDGRGTMRLGMNTLRRDSYEDDDRFRADYLASVLDYQRVRRAIDALLDKRLDEQLGERLDEEHTQACVGAELVDEERILRERMDEFTQVTGLVEGDIVRVPTLLPHALQHGVRVIELQTPVFERSVISFAQKVLTQNHWDTEAAIKRMRLDSPPRTAPEKLIDDPCCKVESIARFPEFAVRRIQLAAGAELPLPPDLPYTLCIGIAGEFTIGATKIAAEAACLVPGSAMFRALTNRGDVEAVGLLAGPLL